MKTDFWASGNHFSTFLVNSQLLPMKEVFHLTKTYWKRGNEVFICFLLLLYSEIFSVSEKYY